MNRQEEMIDCILRHEFDQQIGFEIGSGCFGTCYFLEDNDDLVVKHTSSITEAIYAQRLVGQSHDNVANIQCVVQIDKNYTNQPQFLIVQERLDTEHNELSYIESAFSILDNGFLDIYHPFDLDDYNEHVKSELQARPESIKAIQQVQDGMFFHEVNGNLALDVKPDNLGIKMIDGMPHIALIDQMHLGLERQIVDQLERKQSRFDMSEYVEDVSSLIVKKEFEVLDLLEQEANLEDTLSDKALLDSLVNAATSNTNFNPS